MTLGLGAILLANGLLFHALESTRRSIATHDRAPALALATSLSLYIENSLTQTEARLRLVRDRARQADTTTQRMAMRQILRETLDHTPNLTGLAVRWNDGRVIAAGDSPLPGTYPNGMEGPDRLILEGPILLDSAAGTRILRLIRPIDPEPGEEGQVVLQDTGFAPSAEGQRGPNRLAEDSTGGQIQNRAGNREGDQGKGWSLADMALAGLKSAVVATTSNLPGAQVSVVLGDGQILLHQPPAEIPKGSRFPGFPPDGHPVDGSVVQTPREGIEASAPTLAYRQVPGFPLWVAVSLPRESVLDNWWRSPTPWLSAMALTTLAVFILMGLALARLEDRDRAYRIAHRRHRLLIAQSRLQRALMTALPSPVVVIDARGRVLQASNTFAEWVGSSPAHLKGAVPRDILPEGPAELLVTPLDGRDTVRRDLIWPQADGRPRRVQATLKPLGGSLGASPNGTLTADRSPRKADRPVAKVVAFVDLTDGVSLAEDLTRAKSTLRTFAQAIAVDLRVPLGDMIGRMALLERRHSDDLDKASHQAVHQAIAEGEHMRVLIDDILDYAQVALAPPPRTGVDSNAALEKALVGLASDIKETGADIRAGILPPVRCGEAQLASLLRILVGDAIERAPLDKPAKIRVDGTELDGVVTLTVTDSGLGTTGDTSPEAPAPRPKVGVGLALCGEILRHAGGALDRSTARDGTTVQAVHLPAAPKTSGYRPNQ